MTGKHRCAGRVWHDGSFYSSACMNNGKHEHGGKWWCKVHHPPTVKVKREERERKWDEKHQAEQAQREREQALRNMKNAALDACRKIAAGHNDPRALAQEVLAMEVK